MAAHTVLQSATLERSYPLISFIEQVGGAFWQHKHLVTKTDLEYMQRGEDSPAMQQWQREEDEAYQELVDFLNDPSNLVDADSETEVTQL